MFRFSILTISLLVISIKADNIACPPGTIRPQMSQFCFSFNSKFLNFFGAESECILQNGHLAYISSAFINAAIGARAQNLSWDQYWIGANVVQQEANDATVKIWVWVGSDRYVKFSDWYVKEPNPKNSCAVGKTSDYTWISADCAETRPFICSIPIKINVCDDEWTHFSKTNACYKVFYGKTWDDAALVCQSKMSNLTSIHSEDENNFVVNLAKTDIVVTVFNTTWIGLRTSAADNSDAKSYKWIDGSANDYSSWARGQPDMHTNINEKCTHIISDNLIEVAYGFSVGQWNNAPCSNVVRNFVCKKEANMIQN